MGAFGFQNLEQEWGGAGFSLDAGESNDSDSFDTLEANLEIDSEYKGMKIDGGWKGKGKEGSNTEVATGLG